MNKINYIFDFELDICILNTMTKTNKERANMFKTIILKRLNGKELEILLTALDLYKDKIQDTYQRTEAKEIARDKLANRLEQYADKICEVIQSKQINDEREERG